MEGLGEAERLAIAYAPVRLRSGYSALLALDGVLARIALGAREPLPAQLKLAWWRDGCARLPDARGHPVLAALAESWEGNSAPLTALVDAWEEGAGTEHGFPAAAEAVARQRATALARCAGVDQRAGLEAARAWTLATLADHASDPAERAQLRVAAGLIRPQRLPRILRPLAVLAGLARRAVAADRPLLGDRLSPLAAMRLGIFGR